MPPVSPAGTIRATAAAGRDRRGRATAPPARVGRCRTSCARAAAAWRRRTRRRRCGCRRPRRSRAAAHPLRCVRPRRRGRRCHRPPPQPPWRTSGSTAGPSSPPASSPVPDSENRSPATPPRCKSTSTGPRPDCARTAASCSQPDPTVARQPGVQPLVVGHRTQHVQLVGDRGRQPLRELHRLVGGIGTFGHDRVDDSVPQQVG